MPTIRFILSIILLVAGAIAQDDLRARFEKLDDAGDHDAVVRLWREHPSRVLSTIDSYLEGALRLIERRVTEPARVHAMHARALRGARAADEAFGRVVFSDYAASFVGWNHEQRVRFRSGQRAFGSHRKLMREAADPKLETKARRTKLTQALAEARECLELARPLGDWWGTAMGLGGIGAACERLAAMEEGESARERLVHALDAHARARLLNHDLGLAGAELRSVMAMARILVALDRKPRARETLRAARRLAEAAGERGRAALDEVAALEKQIDR